MLKDYEHNAKYYETDQMGCVHHSNYIRWMEEARVDLMDQMGCGYRAMEEARRVQPRSGSELQVQKHVRFGDTVRIHAWIKEYNGIRMTIGYEMRDASSGELRTRAESAHCFLTLDGRPVSLKRSYPEWDKLFRNMLEMEAGKGE